MKRGLVFAGWLVLLLLALPLCAQASYLGSGRILRDDGTVGYFILGAFNTLEKCEANVGMLLRELTGKARWIGEDLTSRINTCNRGFPVDSRYTQLLSPQPADHYVLFNPSLRIMIVDPRGNHQAEGKLCADVKGYLGSFLSEKAECIAPDKKHGGSD